MSHAKGALSALVLALIAIQARAADAGPLAARPPACAQAAPAHKGARLGGLLAAATRSAALDMLRSGAPAFGSGKGSAVAGAVFGAALNAAGPDSRAPNFNPAMALGGGDRDAQLAAVATGTAIGLARQVAGPAAPPCEAN